MAKRKLIICMMLLVLISVFCAPTFSSTASSNAENFDNINVLDDLMADPNFKLSDYPANSSDKLRVINFVEFCYSAQVDNRANYGLYVYIYNPAQTDIDTKATNRVQMSVADVDGIPSYEKYELIYLNRSTGELNRLFYKFKIKDNPDTSKIVERVNPELRKYDVSGIELINDRGMMVTDYTVGMSYKFSGFAKGFGADASLESTLTGAYEQRETISLDIKKTFYRTGISDLGSGHQNQLNTVYFSVPDRFLEDYGKLQRILAEWWEYKTNPIIVTSNADFYNKALPNVGKYIKRGSFNSDIGYGWAYKRWTDWSSFTDYAINAWNYGSMVNVLGEEYLYYLFKVSNLDFDSTTGKILNGTISGLELENYIKSYKGSGENLPIPGQSIAKELFVESVSGVVDTLNQGYRIFEFDIDVPAHEMRSYSDTNPNFYDKWQSFGFWAAISNSLKDYTGESYKSMTPILAPQDEDLLGTDAEVSKRILINENDVASFKNYRAQAMQQDKTVFLLRFSTSDYFSSMVDLISPSKLGGMTVYNVIKNEAYMVQQRVYLNFDIITLTFNKDGIYTVIPVVANPINIINDITPPVVPPSSSSDFLQSLKDWFTQNKKTILIIAVVIAVIVVLGLLALVFPVLRIVFKFLGFIIALPVLSIIWLIKRIKK